MLLINVCSPGLAAIRSISLSDTMPLESNSGRQRRVTTVLKAQAAVKSPVIFLSIILPGGIDDPR